MTLPSSVFFPPDGDHFTLLRFFFGCVGDDDATFHSLFLFYSLDQNPIVKGLYLHI